MKAKKLYRHKLQDDRKVYMDEDEEKDKDLTYTQIKMIDAPGF